MKFEIPKIFWGGAHRAPSPDPSPRSFSGFALDSGFTLKSQALRALDSGFARFRPPTFEAWLRPCWIMIGKFSFGGKLIRGFKKPNPPPKIGQFQHCSFVHHSVFVRSPHVPCSVATRASLGVTAKALHRSSLGQCMVTLRSICPSSPTGSLLGGLSIGGRSGLALGHRSGLVPSPIDHVPLEA